MAACRWSLACADVRVQARGAARRDRAAGGGNQGSRFGRLLHASPSDLRRRTSRAVRLHRHASGPHPIAPTSSSAALTSALKSQAYSLKPPMAFDFLQLAGQPILVTGVANRKSVAWRVGQMLTAAGADVMYSVRSAARETSVARLVARAGVCVRRGISRRDRGSARSRVGAHAAAIRPAAFNRLRRLQRWSQGISRNEQARFFARDGHIVLFAHGAGCICFRICSTRMGRW